MSGALFGLIRRITAAALALALSGAPQLAMASASPPAHRCHCPAGAQHTCTCPLCHAGAARTEGEAAEDRRLPPCHRALAARARSEQQASQKRAASQPCVTGTCGTGDRSLAPGAVGEYVIPRATALLVIGTETALAPRRGHRPQPVCEPETPPPRAA